MLPDHSLKMQSSHTTKYCLTQTSPSVANFDFDSCMQSPNDTSFEETIHQDNMDNVRIAANRLL
jgi:hypothetical protein